MLLASHKRELENTFRDNLARISVYIREYLFEEDEYVKRIVNYSFFTREEIRQHPTKETMKAFEAIEEGIGI